MIIGEIKDRRYNTSMPGRVLATCQGVSFFVLKLKFIFVGILITLFLTGKFD
jgi:hypothetical protein